MNKISFVLAAALALAAGGCKKKGDDCARAIDHSMELAKADMQKMPGMDDKTMARMHDLGVERCRADQWPAEAIRCMQDAKTEADAQACYGKLSAEQQQKMNQAAMAGAGAAGSGAAGSATGSGSAGSAAGSSSTGSAAAP